MPIVGLTSLPGTPCERCGEDKHLNDNNLCRDCQEILDAEASNPPEG